MATVTGFESYEQAVAQRIGGRFRSATTSPPTSATSTRATSSRWSTSTSTARSARSLGRAAGPRRTRLRQRAARRTASSGATASPSCSRRRPRRRRCSSARGSCGAILLSMSVLYGDDGIRHRLDDSDAEGPRHRRGQRRALRRVARRRRSWCSTTACSARRRPTFETATRAADDPAQLYYTSGTTGLAKGIVHAHRYLLAHEEFVYCHEVQRRRALPRHGRVGVGGRHRAAARARGASARSSASTSARAASTRTASSTSSRATRSPTSSRRRRRCAR